MSPNDPLLRMAGLIQKRLERCEEEIDEQLAAAITKVQSTRAALPDALRVRGARISVCN